MTRFPGALSAVALPSGEWAVVFPGSHIQSHLGPIEPPRGHSGPFDVLYLDITNAGGFKIAGQAQQEPNSPDRGTWMWENGQWRQVSTEAPGTYPVMFDTNGQLHIATPEQNGSQGWRYVDANGALITGDDTLNSQRRIGVALGLADIWEYSDLGGVVIGQGETGCDVIAGGARRRLEDGDTHFIRVRHADGKWAVAMSKLAQDEACIGWFTLEELAALPLVNQPTPPVHVDPVTPHVTPLTPEQPEPVHMPQIPNQSATVARVRAKYPTPLGDSHAACLLELAREIGQGAGLLRKDSGTNILLPDGTRVAQDIIVFPDGDGFDCLGSGETTADPQWGGPVEGSPFPSSRYYKVSAPQPDPGPVTFPHTALLQRFAAAFPLPQSPGGGGVHEDKCRAWCLQFAQQVRFSTGDASCGVKRAGGPQSKDTIAQDVGNGRLMVFEIMSGAESGSPVLNPQPRGQATTGQTFIPVDAVKHLPDAALIPEPPSNDRELLLQLIAKVDRIAAHLGITN